MELLSNQGRRNHRKRLVDLISKSNEMILCSGWLNLSGLNKILPALRAAKQDNHASITIYSNKKHTNQECIDSLSEFNHIVVDDSIKYLHTKLYYFQSDSKYTALIGSANLTLGGLVNKNLSTFSGSFHWLALQITLTSPAIVLSIIKGGAEKFANTNRIENISGQ